MKSKSIILLKWNILTAVFSCSSLQTWREIQLFSVWLQVHGISVVEKHNGVYERAAWVHFYHSGSLKSELSLCLFFSSVLAEGWDQNLHVVLLTSVCSLCITVTHFSSHLQFQAYAVTVCSPACVVAQSVTAIHNHNLNHVAVVPSTQKEATFLIHQVQVNF